MVDSFVYDIPTRIYFGRNQLQHLSREIKKYGNRVLLVYGGDYLKKNGLYDEIIKYLNEGNILYYNFENVKPNPRNSDINKAIDIGKKNKIDVVLAIGGGSAIDSAKAIGVGYYYEGDCWDLVTQKAKIVNCLPIFTILTISATGSEMDAGAVITNEETNDKIAFRNSKMLPKVSFLNPELTYTVNSFQSACGAVDIIAHVLESYFSPNQSMYMLDTFMEGIIRTVIKYGPIAFYEPNNYEARANLMWAASWAINDFIRGDKIHGWSMHPIEHELSAYYDITHGLGLAIVMPRWLNYILDKESLSKFRQLAINVFHLDRCINDEVLANLVIKKFEELFYDTFKLNSNLRSIGIDNSKFEEMSKKIIKNGYLNGYRKLSKDDIVNILNQCL